MSKFRILLGGLAAIGLFSALAVSGLVSAPSTVPHGAAIRAESIAVAPACLSCGIQSDNDGE
jgi:hypothetical protein